MEIRKIKDVIVAAGFNHDDYLVQYGPGDYGPVGREIFDKTYEVGEVS